MSAQAPQTTAPDPSQIQFLGHEFPIRGAHYYGEAAARFGGGRGHQGHDTFAACGTPLVAARGGVVKFKQYHGAAGHYLVIDGERTGIDYTYMHLRDAALVDEGDRVRTGQLIGYVGQTGRASGCHLHFEMWKAPGWYDGGKPVRPAAVAAGLGQDLLTARGRSAPSASGRAGARFGHRVDEMRHRGPARGVPAARRLSSRSRRSAPAAAAAAHAAERSERVRRRRA